MFTTEQVSDMLNEYAATHALNHPVTQDDELVEGIVDALDPWFVLQGTPAEPRLWAFAAEVAAGNADAVALAAQLGVEV